MHMPAAVSPTTISILIVEDDELFAEYLQTHLLDRGYVVAGITNNGLDAIALAQTTEPDLVMMDILLSGEIDGIETANQIHALRQIPILFLTAHEQPEIFERAKITDPSAYLLKPFNERELHFAIELALHRHMLATQREQELETRYEKLFHANPHPMWVCERESLAFLDVNQAAINHYGYARDEFLQMHYRDVLQDTGQQMQALQVDASARHRTSDGSTIDVEISSHDLDYIDKPASLMLVLDVTKRLAIEAENRKLSQLYQTLSETNHAIVRSTSAAEILDASCQIAVKYAQFRLAWIALVDFDTGIFQTVSRAGASDYLIDHPIPAQEYITTSQPSSWKELKPGKHIISDYSTCKPSTEPWCIWAKRGNIASSATFPLFEGNTVIGVLKVYADEVGYFDSEIVRLLEQMTDNIGCAIAGLSLEKKRRQAESAQRVLTDRIAALMETMTDGFVVLDREWRYVFVNRKAGEMFGREPHRLIGRKIWDVFPDSVKQPFYQACHQAMEKQEAIQVESHDPGWERCFENRIYPSSEGISIYLQEITERKKNETALRLANSNYHDLAARIPVGIFTFRICANGQKRFDYVSPRFCQLSGLAAEVIMQDAMRAFDILHDDDRNEFFRRGREAAAATHAMVWEGRVTHNAEVRWVRIESYPTLENSGDTLWNGVEMDITDARLAEAKLAAAHQRLQALSTRLLNVQEEERRNLARELHDEIGQSISALKIGLHSLGMRAETAALQPQIKLAIDIADATLTQVRQMSLDLRPPQLDDLGLPAAIRWNLSRQCSLANLIAHFDTDNVPRQLPETIAIACYRISQEAITNIIKHANASNIWIELSCRHDLLTLSVRDDGHGFDPVAAQAQVRAGTSMGLVSMQERALMANGQLEIEAQYGSGTTVVATFPLGSNDSAHALH